MATKNYTLDHGLIVDNTTTPPTCCGYIFNFNGHGAFDPGGKVKIDGRNATDAEIESHNSLLSRMELDGMKKHGRGVLYLHREVKHWQHEGKPATSTAYFVGTWAAKDTDRIKVYHTTTSFHNMAGRDGRRDVWFNLDGKRWHGVNIGDNDIVRCKMTKN